MARNNPARGKKSKTARRIPGLRPPTPQPAFLFEEFGDGPPHAPPKDGEGSRKRGRIAEIQKLYLLFMAAQGFTSNRVAIELGISNSSAKRIVEEARREPEKLYLWGFVVRWRAESTVKIFCRYCAWIESTPQLAVVHAYGHIWNEDVLEPSPRGM